MRQSKWMQRAGRVGALRARLPTTSAERPGGFEGAKKKWQKQQVNKREKHLKPEKFNKGAYCALSLTRFTRGIYCRLAFEEPELLSEGMWGGGGWGGGPAHTCITEEGTPVHPAASVGRVDLANPGVKADQRTGPESRFPPYFVSLWKKLAIDFVWGGVRERF